MPPIVHVGFPKTASTTLQRCLFAPHPSIHYFGEDGDGCQSTREREAAHSLIFDNHLYFDMNEAEHLFDVQQQRAQDRLFIYSNVDVVRSQSPVMCAERLHHLMPTAEVMFVVRNQVSAMSSFYASHGVYLKPAPPSYFGRYVSLDDWMSYCLMFPNTSPASHYRYQKHITPYIERFGHERVHVLVFEDFVHDRARFLRQLKEIIGLEASEMNDYLTGGHERSRHTQRMLSYRKLRSQFFWGTSLSKYLPFGGWLKSRLEDYLNRGASAKVTGIEKWSSELTQLYTADNSWLMENFDLPLEKYNYPQQ